MSTTEVTIAMPAIPHRAARIRVSTQQYGPDLADLFGGKATIVIETGACGIQTYMTRAELADLILALQLARDELDEQLTPTQLVKAWNAAWAGS